MTLYKGRIGADHRGLMDEINRSLPVDIRLLPYDVLTNRAWAAELLRLEVLTHEEYISILAALDEIETMAEQGAFTALPDDEDVHTLVERLLTEKAGDAGAKIHTGRSRNDQVVCDLRLYTTVWLGDIADDLIALIGVLRDLGEIHAEVLLAGTTHLQPAQPITLGHFLLSLAFALVRDCRRFQDVYARANLCPLGSGALAGSGFPVDRRKLAEELGFDGICENTLDAISDRDFAQETIAACAISCTHLSRYAEQFIIWANPAFGYIRFADEWSTGSSMMPQKRNPDAMELIRAKAARCIGHTASILTLTKGLPPSYAKDLQEDKELLFDAMDTASLCVKVFTEALRSAQFVPERMKKALSADLLATDLADALVEAGVPFRKSHEIVAGWVTKLEGENRTPADVTQAELTKQFPQLQNVDFSLRYEDAVARRRVTGGAAPEKVREQAKILTAILENLKSNK